jgi:hypothetical protein
LEEDQLYKIWWFTLRLDVNKEALRHFPFSWTLQDLKEDCQQSRGILVLKR